MLCFLGSSVVLGQFWVIFYGTFQSLSWDIMEPVCYLMTFGNFTGGFFFYTLMKKDLDLTNIHDIITERFTRSACRSQGIDLDLHEANKAKVLETRDKLRAVIY